MLDGRINYRCTLLGIRGQNEVESSVKLMNSKPHLAKGSGGYQGNNLRRRRRAYCPTSASGRSDPTSLTHSHRSLVQVCNYGKHPLHMAWLRIIWPLL